jgi:hypothetical protein
MKQAIRLTVLSLVVLAVLLFSCQKDPGVSGTASLNKPHSVSIFLTDDQTPVFDSVFIDLQKLEVKLEDDSLSNGGWVTLAIRPGVYNILRLRNGVDTLFASGTLPNAHIQKLRLTLGTRNSVVVGGQTLTLNVHDNDRQVVVDLGSDDFDITQPGQMQFWIDFDAAHSIQVDNSGSGNNNGFRLRSHIRIFGRSNSGSIEGKVLPRAANALVMAINGTDTTMAIPEDDEGEFKIMGLSAGTYKLFIDGRNNYLDTTINNVVVRNREDTHVPAVTLHQ